MVTLPDFGEGLGRLGGMIGIIRIRRSPVVNTHFHLLAPEILHLTGVGVGNQALHLGGVALLGFGIVGFKGVEVGGF